MPLPPGPSQPVALQTLRWMRAPIPFLQECRASYGDTFSVRMALFGKAIFTGDPEGIRQIFTAKAEDLAPGTGNFMIEPVLGKHSLIVLDGLPHRDERKLLTPPFHGDRMRAYGAAIQQIALHHARSWPVGVPFPAFAQMQAISLDVILRAVFGVEDPEKLGEARHALVEMLDALSPITLFVKSLQVAAGPWKKLMTARKRVYALIDGQIAQRRAEPDRPRDDILALLMSARYEDGEAMSDQALRDELLTMLMAGHETTTTSLSWALAELLHNPPVLERLLAELAASSGEPEALSRSPYLDAACKETLRIHPVIPIVSRVTREPWRLLQWELPEGVGVFPCVYLAHFREASWPEPEQFRPERFLERTPSPYEFLPFGGGTRTCIGKAFALYEMKITLGSILRALSLEAAEPRVPEVLRRNLTLTPRSGSLIRVREAIPN